MIYLHDSRIGSHGNLKSSNCLVDSRWVLQISDYGLHEFKRSTGCSSQQQLLLPHSTTTTMQSQQTGDPDASPGSSSHQCHGNFHTLRRKLLWRAPELIRADISGGGSTIGTREGDVYSFAIILYEMFGLKGPWGLGYRDDGDDNPNHHHETITKIDEILDQVANPDRHDGYILRPDLKLLAHRNPSPCVIRCIEDCWNQDPESRPDFRRVNLRLTELQAGL